MSFIVGATPFCSDEFVGTLLQTVHNSATLAEGVDQILKLDQPDQWDVFEQSMQKSEVRTLVFYSSLDVVLETLFSQRAGPEAAVHTWLTACQRLEMIKKANRNKVLLVELQAALKHPQAFADACSQQLQLDLRDISTTSSHWVQPSSITQLVSRQLKREVPQLRRIDDQLKALAWPLGGSAASAAPVNVYDAVQELYQQAGELTAVRQRLEQCQSANQQQVGELEGMQRQLDQAAASEQQLKGEIDQLTKQLHDTQEALEASLGQVSQANGAAQGLRGQLDAAQKQLEQIQVSESQLREENNLVIEQLHKVQGELELSLQNTAKEQEATVRLKSQLKAEQSKHATLQDSHQKILTKHKQQVVQLESAQQELKQSKMQELQLREENNLLIKQLHKVQGELERSLQNTVKEQETTARVKSQLKAEQSKHATLQDSHQKTVANHRQQAVQLERVQQELKQSKVQEQELRQENALVIEQLHKLQEELERHYVDQQGAELLPESKNLPILYEAKPPIRKGLLTAIAEIHKSKKRQKRLRVRAEIIAGSRWFNAAWYLETYSDIAADEKAAANPALHYLKYGGFEGRNPGPEFDSAYYLKVHSDVAASGMNPLWHFIMIGREEGRKYSP